MINIADPGTALGVPPDGRLRGYEFSGEVLGVATGTSLDQSGGTITAASGQKLWVFGMRWTDASFPAGGATQELSPFDLRVSTSSQQSGVAPGRVVAEVPAPGSGPGWFEHQAHHFRSGLCCHRLIPLRQRRHLTHGSTLSLHRFARFGLLDMANQSG